MKVLSYILYGLVLGRWVLKMGRRLVPTTTPGRYVVVAEHCNYNNLYVLVGRLDSRDKAQAVYDAIDASMFFMGEIYDSYHPDGAASIAAHELTPFADLSVDERLDLAEAQSLCDSGK